MWVDTKGTKPCHSRHRAILACQAGRSACAALLTDGRLPPNSSVRVGLSLCPVMIGYRGMVPAARIRVRAGDHVSPQALNPPTLMGTLEVPVPAKPRCRRVTPLAEPPSAAARKEAARFLIIDNPADSSSAKVIEPAPPGPPPRWPLHVRRDAKVRRGPGGANTSILVGQEEGLIRNCVPCVKVTSAACGSRNTLGIVGQGGR